MKRFRPGLVPTLVVLALLPTLVALGCWQLSRAEHKRALLAMHAARQLEEPLTVERLRESSEPAFRRVQLRGRFDARHSILLDNRMRGGKAGVELLQPFQDEASGVWLLVNRGWLAWPDRRLPVTFETPSRSLALQAWVHEATGQLLQLRADPVAGQWPRLLNGIEPRHLWQELEREGIAHELRLEPGPASYRLDWPVVTTEPEKHLGYAVQWFALATALLALYLYFGWNPRKENPHVQRDPSDGHA
ncbi:SURF1 family protein [Pseudomonas fulva]|nr:SURF1 family protein [Pseudomonas fulva]MBF8778706.1 SURF1 family protein [Pseudomonas fulva]